MLTQPTRNSLLSLSPHGFHRLVYWQWGDPENPRTVFCVHGLTRNGRDFDDLARVLARDFRVICPDMPGRGESEWLRDPRDYALPTYLASLSALIARLDVDKLSWVGTSMGGILGMVVASLPGTPTTRLVLNDVGPLLTQSALDRIGQYVGADPRFATLQALEQNLRTISASFGPLSDAQWQRLAEVSGRRVENGLYALNYDPRIAVVFKETSSEASNMWSVWDNIRCPTLVLRGSVSDLLTPETAKAMTERGPRATLIEVPRVGHAPTLQDPWQIDVVEKFLAQAS